MITSPAAEMPDDTVNSQEIVIEAGKTELHYWRDLWRFRELFYFLAWRDILVRYKQTAIGIAWAVVQPLTNTFISVFVFKVIAKLPSEGPYPIMVFAAQLPWQFFSRALSEACNSLINNNNLISKVYFPRLIIPAASVITAFIDFLISAGLLAIMMLCYHFSPDWRVIFLPYFLLLAVGAAMGSGLWFAAVSVKYRDFRYILPFLISVGAIISPVGYPSATIPDKWRLFYSLNPLVGIIEGFRYALLGANSPPLYIPAQVFSVVIISVTLATGIIYFRSTEKGFADVI